jgi:hypothetical protein
MIATFCAKPLPMSLAQKVIKTRFVAASPPDVK